MKAIVKNTIKSYAKSPSAGFAEAILLALAIAVLLVPIT